MRVILFFSIFGLWTALFGQDEEITQSGDSLTIRASNIATNPFNFQKAPLNYLLTLGPKISRAPIKNLQVENKIDTIYTLLLGRDRFYVYKLDKTINFLTGAEIHSARFKTKQKIAIGATKQEVLKILTDFHVKKIPDCLILESLEIPESLTFEFDKGKVTRIVFNGYYD